MTKQGLDAEANGALAALRRARKEAERVALRTGTYRGEAVDGKPVRVAPRPEVPASPNTSKSGKTAFLGQWRITEMEQWDQDAVDLAAPARIEFRGDRSGELHFVAVDGWMDCRFGKRDGQPLVEFSWQGSDEGDEAMGRGWAVINGVGNLTGRIFIHDGDDSAFEAVRFEDRSRARPQRR